MDEAYVGIDVAFAKRKRLPLVVCVRRGNALHPLPLRTARALPPVGEGNARILDGNTVDQFARDTVAYLRSIESEFCIKIRRVAIDAPSDPRSPGTSRRSAEIELDRRQIRCFTTPALAQFETIRLRAMDHLAHGGTESTLPAANQLWMLVGFALFRELRPAWECLEVFPQAIARVLGVGRVHKSKGDGLKAQLRAAARHTSWPGAAVVDTAITGHLAAIGYGSRHDRLDAYLAAWVASLDRAKRKALGEPPNDVIWVPRLNTPA